MSLRMQLEAIAELPAFAVSKDVVLPEQFLPQVLKGEDAILVPCRHLLFQGASAEQLATLEANLPLKLPDELVLLLSASNGAHLFEIEYDGGPIGRYTLPRYKILATEEILDTYRGLRKTYTSYLDDFDEGEGAFYILDYLPFCDVGDGDFLALVVQGDRKGSVFLLDHDYGYFPYHMVSDPSYQSVANSIEEWLSMLYTTLGRSGAGTRYYPL